MSEIKYQIVKKIGVTPIAPWALPPFKDREWGKELEEE